MDQRQGSDSLSHNALAAIAMEILRHYRLDPLGIHGVSHWCRVLENGENLAESNGADVQIVQLFSLFHDSRRINDNRDPGHGARGAALAGTMNGLHFTLSPSDLALLQDACRRHTDGATEADITVQTCWDADRLDLLRAGIRPLPERLCTPRARNPEFISWSSARSRANHMTPLAIEIAHQI